MVYTKEINLDSLGKSFGFVKRIAFLGWLIAVVVVHADPLSNVHSLTVTSEGFTDADEAAEWTSWCDAVVDEIGRLGGRHSQAKEVVNLKAGGSFRIRSLTPLRMTIDPFADKQRVRYFLTSGLVEWWFATISSRTGPPAKSAPAWLIAGIEHRASRRVNGLLQSRRFPACKALVESEQAPQLDQLLDLELTPAAGPLYNVYAEFCDCWLRILRKHDPEILLRLVHTLASITKNDIVVSSRVFQVLNELGDHQQIQQWYRDEFNAIVIDQRNRFSLAATKNRIDSLQTFSTIMPGEDGSFDLKDVPIEELASYSLAYDNRIVGIVPLYEGFFDLLYDGHPTLVPTISMFLAALDFLRSGDVRHYRTKLQDARRKLDADYARGIEIVEYLQHLEYIWNVGTRITPLMNAVGTAHHEYSMPEIRLTRYLDEIEMQQATIALP